MPVTLIGYRGCGKSAVGEALAGIWQCDFVDADSEIENRAGKTIREIFADSGEPEFRRIERDVMAELLRRDRLVIAAGGGAVMNVETQADLATSGPVVWLKAEIDTLLARIGGDATTADRRPNLTPQGGRAEVEALLAQREPVYQKCATLTVTTDELPISQIARQIDAAIPGGLPKGNRS